MLLYVGKYFHISEKKYMIKKMHSIFSKLKNYQWSDDCKFKKKLNKKKTTKTQQQKKSQQKS